MVVQILSPVLQVLIIVVFMLVQTTQSFRVAILGSGIAGSTAARTLADRGIEVTVFEAGFGIGGRTSTRVTRDEHQYQFDHGAQHIGLPKTDVFRDALEQWRSGGFVEEWKGRFLTATNHKVEEDEKKGRFVGYPGMHSICQNLLKHENIEVILQTQAHASRNEGNTWGIIHGKTKQDLGTFDWLIVSDRNSANYYRRDLSSADVKEFTSAVRKAQSTKSLTAMVVFEEPLGLNIDGVLFAETGDDSKYGSLGWVARDSSKPGRQRNDGKECWVLQSNPTVAKKMLKGKKKIGEMREMAKEVLVNDFLKCLPILTNANENELDLPRVVTEIGHRWGAAFPNPSEEFLETTSQFIAEKKFAACGDYFGLMSGRIEGAYLSGLSAANRLCDEIC